MYSNELVTHISPALHRLLALMFGSFRSWRPRVGYPTCSAGLASGGVVGISSFEDMEDEADSYAIRVTEAAYAELRTPYKVAIEVAMGLGTCKDPGELRPLLRDAVSELETRLRRQGLLLG